MTTYTYAQLEGLWINAGGSSALAPTMAAIAEAESGGNSDAANPSGATGLWQILGAVNPADQGNLTDPATNAHEAVLKYQSQGLGAWVTYTSGAYKAFMNGGTSPDTSVPGGSASTTAASSGAATLATYNSADCLLGIPNLNPIPSWVPIAGSSTGVCLLSKAEARGMLGGMLMLTGGGVAVLGVVILASAAFQRTGALGKAADVAAVVPGGQGVAAGLAIANRRASRTGEQARARHSRRPADGAGGPPAGTFTT